ncbi:indole-3-glycerol-phosphate synthase [Megalodesulfovibrio gigas]|uniref:indole-3-glycerol-phosphate synthase n=1 Tax=Megalodesulfovibrio gigas (strain ATCC 19364 / DSM 1382 / NCIMB 9332 / VKM B-1759) TaxID=1121448 RepID=T2G896_MEGG1|nr:indole-3-glycerol-phosphate synthase [Megalodesulfovibrio gigas]AGW12508.1 putative indole-3-glycerol-phosphate synthase [Megalodesulfovibrio gigas DSM 1382 = ATCC 19364]
MLARFRQAQEPGIARLRTLAAAGALPPARPGPRLSLAAVLAAPPLAVIAEYKRASPSKGPINLALSPEDVAEQYARGGASAISVLTEEQHFQGSLQFLERMANATGLGLPLLRKDFLLDPLQLVETAATPAAAALVIVRMFETDDALAGMLRTAESLGVEAVVEIFDETDLRRARTAMGTLEQAATPRIIQVNNRDLDTLRMDMDTSARLAAFRQPGELWISASGMSRPGDLAQMRALRYDGVLVGSSLMAAPDPGSALHELLSEVRP